MVTIKDIAKLSGYSIGTVSRVINQRSDVSPAAREIIERVIREQNFQPNTNARFLKQALHSPVTVIVKGIGNPFLESILEAIQISMQMHGESVNVTFLDEQADEIAEAVRTISRSKPKGLIFLGGSLRNFRDGFAQIGVPSVLVTADAAGLGFPQLSSFCTDDSEAAAEAVRRLLAGGHRRIGILGGYPVSYPEDNSMKRFDGALEELRKHGIGFDRDRDYEGCGFSMAEGEAGVIRLLRKAPDLTAIFALGDMIAIGAMKGLRTMGRQIPEDISIIGFDGIGFGSYTNPCLATIRQDTNRLASRTVETLLLQINTKRPAVHEMIPYEFTAGDSISDLHRPH
ncbi:MAG: LacI family DNA-binding transcriptional regulator [Solobacterium sp.]|nr:LacI family DNA-binding transcriptional regulator [Solobacterium sp.]